MKKFLAEFQAFISRGNVLDLAVAVIIGAAFNGIVTSLVKDIVNPIVGFLVGKPDFTNLFWVLKRPEGYTGPETYEALTAAGATVFGYGAFLTSVVNFLLLAFVIFWLINNDFLNRTNFLCHARFGNFRLNCHKPIAALFTHLIRQSTG